MAVFIGSTSSKFDELDSFRKDVLKELKSNIKNKKKFPKSKLEKALLDLKEAKSKFGGKKSTKMNDLFNDAQQDIISKELKNRI